MTPQLTVGMAHYDDYDGAYFTIQSIRAHHYSDDVEILVVDNHPESPHGRDVRNLVEHWAHGKYLAAPEAVGTSVPRDRVFRAASAPVVLCVDCHVLLTPGSLDALMTWWDTQPDDSRDMLTGPLLNDGLGVLATQYNDVWRAEMWGVWGTTWACRCSRSDTSDRSDRSATHFTPVEQPDDGLTYRAPVSQETVTACPLCDEPFPQIGWAGHQRALADAGYVFLGDGREPFEILGMGLGLFSMRRDAWVGFHPQARGFGGEELYVHEKVRRAGGRVWCHPGVRWLHRFARPGGVRYPISRYGKARNYVLEFQELHRDIAPIREHFVGSGLLSQRDWDHLLSNPAEHVTPPGGQPAILPAPCAPAAAAAPDGRLPPAGDHNLDTLFAWCSRLRRDLDQHAAKIRELAGQAQHVTAIVKRREWDVFLLAGRPDDVVIYTTERDPLHAVLHHTVERTEVRPDALRRIKHYTVHDSLGLALIHQIEPTDLLCLDTIHSAEQLTKELAAYAPQVRRRIVLRGTQAFGERAEGTDGPGLLVALRQYLRQHPEWSVIYHSPRQYGLTVISRDPADKPKLPGVITLAKNFAKAVAEHVADGLTHVTPAQLESRLQACTICDQRNGDRCAVCGCYSQPKAAMRSSDCPLGRWPDVARPTELAVPEASNDPSPETRPTE